MDGRTRALVQALQRARNADTQMARAEELCDHLLNFNEASSVAVKVLFLLFELPLFILLFEFHMVKKQACKSVKINVGLPSVCD